MHEPASSRARGYWSYRKQVHKYLTHYLNMARPEPAIPGDRHFFLSLDGYPLQQGIVRYPCVRLSKYIVMHIHCHRFRHAFAMFL